MIKVKLKPEDSSFWPTEYRGREVDVEILQVRFPNGITWTTEGDAYCAMPIEAKPAPLPSPVVHGPSSLRDLAGSMPKRVMLEIDYFSSQEVG